MRKIILLTPLLALFSLFTFNAFGADITCDAGEFLSKEGGCETCRENYYCKGGTWTPDDKEHGLNQCPEATPYSDKGAKGKGDCYAKTDTIGCDTGSYLPKGDNKCVICPIGSYCSGIKGVTVDNTKDQGIEKCPTTAPYSKIGSSDENSCFDTTTCKNGEFLPAFSYSDCKTCPAGSYCKGGKYPYSETGDQGIEQCPTTSPFSESGSDDSSDCKANLVCLAGTYLGESMLTCSTCPAGYWCSGGTFTNNTATQGMTKCDTATPFSPDGATSSTQCSATIDCGAGVFLAKGGIQCTDCQEGYFCDGTKSPYSYDDKNDQGLTQCPTTAPYSDKGAKGEGDCYGKTTDITCGAGEFLSKDNKCETCWANYYCKGGTWTPDDKEHGLNQCPEATPYSDKGAKGKGDCYAKTDTIGCDTGSYLPKGDNKCVICPIGSYCSGIKGVTVDNTKDQGIEKCPTTAPYSKIGASDENSCFDTVTCKAGEFLPAFSYSDCRTCPAGSYCKGGKYPYSETNDQGIEKCPTTSPFSESGSDDSSDCKANLVCLAGTYLGGGTFVCSICPSGNYCVGGTFTNNTSTQGITKCDTSTPFSPAGATSSTQCSATINCAEGEFLPVEKTDCESCWEGYYCDGTKSPYSYDDKNHQGLTQCPDDKPYSDKGAKGDGDCYAKTTDITCSAGEFLSKDNKCETCWIKYYCKGGTWTPDDKEHGLDQCPTTAPYSNPGAKSESDCYATIYDITCNAGEYLPKDKDYECAECLGGYYCKGGGFYKGQDKDQGLSQCPTTAPYSNPGAKGESDCYAKTDTIDCETGYYLPMGFDKCDICPSGSYCKGGKYSYSETNDQGIEKCPTTSPFSESGSDDSSDCKANLVCLAGTYLGGGTFVCSICPSGNYCVGGTFTNNTSTQGITKCDTSTPFSPAGATSSTQCSATINCAEGELLKAGSTQCDPCWEGYFCSGAKGLSFNDKEDQGLSECSKVDSNNPLSDLGAKSADDCYAAKCEAGEYLPEKSTKCQSCPKAKSCNGGNFKYGAKGPQGFTYSCDAGYYLPADSEDCALCPSDYYCPGVTDVELDEDDDQGLYPCPTSTPYSLPGTASSGECSATMQIICPAGQYLPKNATSCIGCPANYYCPGGIYPYNDSDDQGKIACNVKYPNSDAGSSFLQQCYSTSGSYSCSKINPVSNGTATYANSSSGSITYSDAGRETEDIGACEIISLSCDTGYVKEPSSNGPLANYVNQAHSISKSSTLYRAASGNSGANSGVANGFGDSTGMTDGTAVITWSDGTQIYLDATCNSTAGTSAGEYKEATPKTKSGNSGGAKAGGTDTYCWCQMTGYDIGNGSTSVNDANSVYVPIRSPATCTDNCAEQCVAYFMSNTTVRTNIIGEYGEQMACVEQTYSCDPGYYFPANSTTCTLCEAGYYCPGFTDVPASNISANKPYGRESCPDDHPSSDAGTTDVTFCYYDKTGVDCSTLVKILNTTSVSYANSPVTQRNYYGGGSVVTPFGGCAVTGATCSNAGEVLVGTDGPLANYESPLYGMPSSTSNHNIYYRAIDGSSDNSSGANGNYGDSTGMTNGTFRLVYWNELDITGTASCAVNANGKYDCNCDLTSYKIGSGNTVSVNPAERLFKTDFIDISICEKKCANACAMQLALAPEFGSFGMNKSCGAPVPTYTCAPGEYLPANATVCATCPQNHWCPGGTWEKVSFAQGLSDCPSEFPYSDAGSRDVAFCYRSPATLLCSVINPVRGANVTYANSTAATRIYDPGTVAQTESIGACAISSFTCNAGYTATTPWSDGPLVNYINASRNLNLSATKFKSNDSSTQSGTGEFFGGDATSLNKGTFELVYSNGTKIQGRSSCNSTSGDLFEPKTNGTFNTLSVGKECWCNMTGYHLNGSSAVSVSDTNWVYWDAFGDQNSCATTCTERCIQVLFQPENSNGEYETALFGSYGPNSAPPCNPNSYSITWYDGNNNLETNQCYYDEHLTIPSSATARTGYKIKWQIRTGN